MTWRGCGSVTEVTPEAQGLVGVRGGNDVPISRGMVFPALHSRGVWPNPGCSSLEAIPKYPPALWDAVLNAGVLSRWVIHHPQREIAVATTEG